MLKCMTLIPLCRCVTVLLAVLLDIIISLVGMFSVNTRSVVSRASPARPRLVKRTELLKEGAKQNIISSYANDSDAGTSAIRIRGDYVKFCTHVFCVFQATAAHWITASRITP